MHTVYKHLVTWESSLWGQTAPARFALNAKNLLDVKFVGIEKALHVHFWIIHSSYVGYRPFKKPPVCVCVNFVYVSVKKTQRWEEKT